MTVPAAPWWLTAAEIAARRLPGLPSSKRGVNAWADAEGWKQRTAVDGSPLARNRVKSGGGTEYHVSLFPITAQKSVAAAARVAPIAANDATASAAGAAMPGDGRTWPWFEAQSPSIRAAARTRLAIITEVESLASTGMPKTRAIGTVAPRHDVSPRAVAGWLASIRGIATADRLPHLAPAYRGGGKQVEIDPEAWRILKTDYLRPERPAFAACYNRLVEDYARPNGIALPDKSTLLRRLDREISKGLKKAKRVGREASRRSVPPQQRSVADLHAMEAVNIDGHTFDVFVQWEDGRIGRPVMVGVQDVAHRKLLAHRIGETESTLLTRLCFADLFRDYGIPPHAVMDNGRAFASKALTGGSRSGTPTPPAC